jgi:hypothetical protein
VSTGSGVPTAALFTAAPFWPTPPAADSISAATPRFEETPIAAALTRLALSTSRLSMKTVLSHRRQIIDPELPETVALVCTPKRPGVITFTSKTQRVNPIYFFYLQLYSPKNTRKIACQAKKPLNSSKINNIQVEI